MDDGEKELKVNNVEMKILDNISYYKIKKK